MSDQAKFVEGNLLRHITVMSLAASVGLMAIFFVDFVDMIFISMLGKAELAAAIGYSGAILFFTSSAGIGMSIAGGALVARALGAGDTEKARRLTSSSLVWGFGVGVSFAAIVWFNLDVLVGLIGATGETAVLAEHYLAIIVPSLPFLMLGMMSSAVLRAYGDARRSMMATIWGGVVNAVLDPIFIFAFSLDLTGAAMASVAARLTIAVMAMRPLIVHYGGIERPTPRALFRDTVPILAIAVPAILTQLATPLGQAYVTRAMAEFGEVAVAGMAVVSRLTPMAFAAIFALSGAVGPIFAQNLGAGKSERVVGTLRDAVIFVAIYVVLAALALFVMRDLIVGLFQADGTIAQDLIYLFCGPLALMYFFNGVMFVANAGFNNLGHPYYSTALNWGRHTLGTIPFVMLGAWMYGAPGVLIGQAVGGVIFAAIAWRLAVRVVAANEPVKMEPFQRERRLLGIFHARR